MRCVDLINVKLQGLLRLVQRARGVLPKTEDVLALGRGEQVVHGDDGGRAGLG